MLVLGPEPCPLFDAEAMLFVAHTERERFKRHVVFQYGMRADQKADLPAFQITLDRFFFLCRNRAGQQTDPIFGEITHCKGKALPRKHLRRRQQNRLITACESGVKRAQRHRRFSAAHITLQKPIHDGSAAQIGKNVVYRLFLPVCKGKRKALGKALQAVRIYAVTPCSYLFPASFYKAECGNQREIFLYRNALGRQIFLLEAIRLVNGAIGVI